MSPSGAVLFINKSAKSKTLSRSEGVERKEIYSHVQQLPVSKTDNKALVLKWKVRTASDRKLQSKGNYSTWPSVDEDGSGCHRKKARGGRRAKSSDEDELTRPRDLSPAAVSIQSLEASKLDPFSCSAVPIDERMTIVLKICTLPRSISRREKLTHLHSLQFHDQQDLHRQIVGKCQSPQDPGVCIGLSRAALRPAIRNDQRDTHQEYRRRSGLPLDVLQGTSYYPFTAKY